MPLVVIILLSSDSTVPVAGSLVFGQYRNVNKTMHYGRLCLRCYVYPFKRWPRRYTRPDLEYHCVRRCFVSNGTRPSPSTLVTTSLNIFFKFLWVFKCFWIRFHWSDDFIRNDWQNLARHCGPLRVVMQCIMGGKETDKLISLHMQTLMAHMMVESPEILFPISHI